MEHRIGFMSMVLSLLLGNYLTYSYFDVKDLVPLKCRIAGVALVEREGRMQKFNYTMAGSACEALGLQLANRAQVEKAWSYGFETCSYGWVMERYGVISRIQNNEKCGRNQTGVLSWTIPLSGFFNAYCFNASDTRINSCRPELMVTAPPSTVAPTTATPVVGTMLPASTYPTGTEAREQTTVAAVAPTTSAEESGPSTLMTSLKPTPRTPPLTTTFGDTTPAATEELPNQPENRTAQKHDKIVFGGLPTALLILALLFFIAAVGLAICYVRRYKTNSIFRKIKEEKEAVEAKVFRETGEHLREDDVTTNGKEDKPQHDNTRQSIEAEV